jgi:aminoglycoside phosphotransferase (APT) family kinase protein
MRHAPIIPSLGPVREWTAEVTVDEALARRLIGGQFPQVELDPLVLLGEGWDNTVWLAGGEWVFRFPRRELAIAGFERELATLPALAPRLPLPVPDPVWRGRPTDEFRWPWFGARQVPGVEPLGLGEEARRALARPLARFLRVLHSAPLIAELPDDPMGRADMAIRVGRTEESLIDLEREGLWRAPPSVAPLLEAAAPLPRPEPVSVVHGDLHMRHLLVDPAGALCGVIDFGDICIGDPAVDLSLLWSLLPGEGRADFLAEYGPLREDQLVRARVLALNLCAILALYGHHEGMTAVKDEALAGLDRAASLDEYPGGS